MEDVKKRDEGTNDVVGPMSQDQQPTKSPERKGGIRFEITLSK
jgi:hypothetical protein